MITTTFDAANVPVLETQRLIMRRHRIEDLGPCALMWGDPRVTQHIGGKPFTREEVWARILRYVGHWALMGFGYWLVEEKVTGDFVGEVGFGDFRRDVDPSLEGMAEAGWALAFEARGKGYATEALQAAISWGEASIRSRRIVCLIDEGNHASVRVAENCGFRPWREATYKGTPSKIYAR